MKNNGTLPKGRCPLIFSDNQDAQFVEQVKRQEYQRERERIACRGDECGKNKQHYDGMATVAAEHFPLEETYGGKSPGQQWKFEHESHQENQHQECVHIGIQRKLVFNCGAELVFVKKPQGDGKNEEIADGDSDEKHDGTEEKRRARTPYFVVIKGRFDKAPQEIEHERKGERERQPE